MQWKQILVEMILTNQLLPNSDAILLLSKLDEMQFEISWAKNTDLIINGHITDAALWVAQRLAEQRLDTLPLGFSNDLATYLNGQVKRINKRKEKFVPLDVSSIIVSRLLTMLVMKYL
jgi:hypothetical protein